MPKKKQNQPTPVRPRPELIFDAAAVRRALKESRLRHTVKVRV